MRELLAALRFFTVVPLPPGWGEEAGDLRGAVPHLPVVGLLIGLLVAGVDVALQGLLPPNVVCVLDAVALLAVSGALHLDGLADTADGFLSARPPDRILEIMRDSRIGTMGVAAVVTILAVKISALQALGSVSRPAALVLMALAGRCAIVWMLAVLPYARPGGLATIFAGASTWIHAAWAATLVLLVSAWVGGSMAVGVTAGAMAATVAMAAWCRRKIGGMTGDTLGAACEVTEAVVAVVVAAWVHAGATVSGLGADVPWGEVSAWVAR